MADLGADVGVPRGDAVVVAVAGIFANGMVSLGMAVSFSSGELWRSQLPMKKTAVQSATMKAQRVRDAEELDT